ncbi:MAG TPA: AMP-binding protein [Clostridia bacterium]|nr:AMP-binding protein [Clostridia bacterium]
MSSLFLKVFHSLPPAARNLAASLHGRRLSHWRYGLETDRLVADALQRERWTADQWASWQQSRLSELLRTASHKVPFYRNGWSGSHARGLDPARLADWPILQKKALRGSPHQFLSQEAPQSALRLEQTSGTTGTPLTLWQSRATAQSWYALMEARWRGWYGLSRADRWGILGGQLVTPQHQQKPPFWVWNSALNQLYCSSYHISPETCGHYLDEIKTRRLVYLWGYASSLYSLAMFAQERHLQAPQLKVVISNAEPLYDHQRELISRVFQCPVRNTYGMSENTAAASECEAGSLHLWPEVGVYEVLSDDSNDPVPPGETGRLICTGFLNADMPLIRYEVGDRVSIAPPTHQCPCGRTLPILLSVEGRSDDVILTPDGRRIGRLDPVFKADLHLKEAQIIQESLDVLRVLIVPAQNFSATDERQIIAALRQRIGDISIKVERVTHIPRTANGKFRAVISKVHHQNQPSTNQEPAHV